MTCIFHGNSIEFDGNVMRIPWDLPSFSTKLPSKWHGKNPCHIFSRVNMYCTIWKWFGKRLIKLKTLLHFSCNISLISRKIICTMWKIILWSQWTKQRNKTFITITRGNSSSITRFFFRILVLNDSYLYCSLEKNWEKVITRENGICTKQTCC